MKPVKTAITLAIGSLLSAGAFAQGVDEFVQRNVNQQGRIEQGLRSGELTVREAARLEREESRVERLQSRALQDGRLTQDERQAIDRAQDRVSRDIARERGDLERGDPNSASSRRMQADVARNVEQQRRIEQGVRNGELTNREVAQLERGQARVNREEARSGRDGWVDRGEQRHIQRAENAQSGNIWRERHDMQARDGGPRRGMEGMHEGGPRRGEGGMHEQGGEHRGWRGDDGARGQAWNRGNGGMREQNWQRGPQMAQADRQPAFGNRRHGGR